MYFLLLHKDSIVTFVKKEEDIAGDVFKVISGVRQSMVTRLGLSCLLSYHNRYCYHTYYMYFILLHTDSMVNFVKNEEVIAGDVFMAIFGVA
jgi:hypothetical protein